MNRCWGFRKSTDSFREVQGVIKKNYLNLTLFGTRLVCFPFCFSLRRIYKKLTNTQQQLKNNIITLNLQLSLTHEELHVQTHIELPALFLNGVHPVEQSVYSSFNVTTRESEGMKYKSIVDTQQHVSLLNAHFYLFCLL